MNVTKFELQIKCNKEMHRSWFVSLSLRFCLCFDFSRGIWHYVFEILYVSIMCEYLKHHEYPFEVSTRQYSEIRIRSIRESHFPLAISISLSMCMKCKCPINIIAWIIYGFLVWRKSSDKFEWNAIQLRRLVGHLFNEIHSLKSNQRWWQYDMSIAIH